MGKGKIRNDGEMGEERCVNDGGDKVNGHLSKYSSKVGVPEKC